jgi:recombination protein RecR
MKLPKEFKNLVSEIEKLPGIGNKTAMRLALYLIQSRDSNAIPLSKSIVLAKERIRKCSICGSISSEDVCDICNDSERDRSKICIVENVDDLIAIEKASFYNGLYHVLGGVVSPLDDIYENSLNIESLESRLKDVKEIIFSLPSSVEADATFLVIRDRVKAVNPNIPISKVAIGLPVGSNIDYADSLTLIRSFENRYIDR